GGGPANKSRMGTGRKKDGPQLTRRRTGPPDHWSPWRLRTRVTSTSACASNRARSSSTTSGSTASRPSARPARNSRTAASPAPARAGPAVRAAPGPAELQRRPVGAAAERLVHASGAGPGPGGGEGLEHGGHARPQPFRAAVPGGGVGRHPPLAGGPVVEDVGE